jgi:hypothetical protein
MKICTALDLISKIVFFNSGIIYLSISVGIASLIAGILQKIILSLHIRNIAISFYKRLFPLSFYVINFMLFITIVPGLVCLSWVTFPISLMAIQRSVLAPFMFVNNKHGSSYFFSSYIG